MAENKIKLSKADRRSVMLRSQFLQGSWNYERMQNGGWAYSLIPALKKLYPKKEDASAALKRHMEFFNTHPYIAAPILGVTLALEEERANGAAIDDAAIQGVKVGMMGPLAGIGDPVFWFTVRPILGAIAASLATGGSVIAPLFFFILWNVIRISFLWYTQEFGYQKGSEITKDLSGGLLQTITKGASILGMFVMGILVQNTHEPYITDEQQQFIIELLRERKNHSSKSNRNKLPALFRGLISCPCCHRKLSPAVKKLASGNSSIYYKCTYCPIEKRVYFSISEKKLEKKF